MSTPNRSALRPILISFRLTRDEERQMLAARRRGESSADIARRLLLQSVCGSDYTYQDGRGRIVTTA